MSAQQEQGASGVASKPSEAVAILYTNHRGETAVRRITPIAREWFGSSDWHPEPQWLFTAFDLDKEAFRDFARAGVKAWGQAAVDAALSVPASCRDGGTTAWQIDWKKGQSGYLREALVIEADDQFVEVGVTDRGRIDLIVHNRASKGGNAFDDLTARLSHEEAGLVVRALIEAGASGAQVTPPGVPDSLKALSEAACENWSTNEATPYILGPPIDGEIDRFEVIARGPHGYAKNGDDIRKWQANRMFAVSAVKYVRTLLASHPAGQSAGSGEDEIVSARLTAWRDGHGGVDIAFASGRRIAIALDAPHVGAPTAMLKARNARLGETAGLGDLPNRIFAFLMDGCVHEVSDLYHLIKPGEDHKKVWNAVSYLNRRGSIVKLKRGRYQIGREFFLGAPAPDSTRTGDEGTEDWRDDPSADDRWCAGVDYAQKQLCDVLGIDPDAVCWDAATETVDGDIQAVICGILAAWAGDDWQDKAARPAAPEAQGADIEDRLSEILTTSQRQALSDRLLGAYMAPHGGLHLDNAEIAFLWTRLGGTLDLPAPQASSDQEG